MRSIEVANDQRTKVNMAHAEYSRIKGEIEALIEGPPVFSGGAVATGYTLIASQGFVDYLEAVGVPIRLAE